MTQILVTVMLPLYQVPKSGHSEHFQSSEHCTLTAAFDWQAMT